MSEKVIYQIKNQVNNKIYIGSTVDRKKRWQEHKRALRSGYHNNQHLQRAWNKYGAGNFEFTVVEIVDSEDRLLDREQYYLDAQKPEYNIALDAKAPMQGKKFSNEHREKLSEAQKGRQNPWYNKSLSKEHKEKISKANKGKNAGEDHYLYGDKLPEEHRKNVSKALTGKKYSDKRKKNISKALQGENSSFAKLTNKKVKIVKHLLKNGVFKQKQIGAMFGVSPRTISDINNGRSWSHIDISN